MGGFSMGDLAIGRIVMTAAFAGPGTSDHRAAHGASPNAGEVQDFTFGLITDTTGRILHLGQTNDVLTPSAATHNLLRLSSQEWSGSEALRPPKAAPGHPTSCPTCKSLKAEFLAHSGSPANAFWLESIVDQESFARSILNP